MTTNLLSVIEQQHKALEGLCEFSEAAGFPTVAARAAIAAGQQALATQGEASEFDSPLSDFKEDQWWTLELDAIANSSSATNEQRRAIAVVRHLLRVIAATHPQATDPAPSALGMKIIVDDSMPADELRLVQNGKTVGAITNIAAPSAEIGLRETTELMAEHLHGGTFHEADPEQIRALLNAVRRNS